MCESNAYIKDNGNEILYLESVNILRSQGGKIYLKNFWGKEKVFNGELCEMSLIKHRIILCERLNTPINTLSPLIRGVCDIFERRK